MRKLASIQRIHKLSPIAGADRIEMASILGWNVIVQKGLYEEGDLAVYFEIDSVLPEKHFPDMEKYHYRIRTIKLKGVISQGYCMPLHPLVRMVGWSPEPLALEEGLDLTELIGVTKYELPESFKTGDTAGSFPVHLASVTDETRLQSCPGVLDDLRGKPYVITQKQDGCSSTFAIDNDGFCACSRNLKKKDGDNVFWNMARKYALDWVLKDNPYLVIQGEICGPGLQKNRLGLNEFHLYVFNIVKMDGRKLIPFSEMESFCRQYNLEMSPVIETGNDFNHTQESLLKLAEGFYPNTTQQREGIVIRPLNDPNMYSPALGTRLSFKVINNLFLLSGGE